MAESNPSSWREDMSGRERIRYVVELLEEPTPVQEIADRANVSRTTADDDSSDCRAMTGLQRRLSMEQKRMI